MLLRMPMLSLELFAYCCRVMWLRLLFVCEKPRILLGVSLCGLFIRWFLVRFFLLSPIIGAFFSFFFASFRLLRFRPKENYTFLFSSFQLKVFWFFFFNLCLDCCLPTSARWVHSVYENFHLFLFFHMNRFAHKQCWLYVRPCKCLHFAHKNNIFSSSSFRLFSFIGWLMFVSFFRCCCCCCFCSRRFLQSSFSNVLDLCKRKEKKMFASYLRPEPIEFLCAERQWIVLCKYEGKMCLGWLGAAHRPKFWIYDQIKQKKREPKKKKKKAAREYWKVAEKKKNI